MTPAPVFRRATVADLPAILAMLADDILGAAREGDPSDPAYLSAFRAIEADPNELLAVAEIDGRVAGTVQIGFLPGLSRKGAWRGQIEAVRVAAPFRGWGLGEAMIRWALDQCRARGCAVAQLTTDKRRADAQRFYARLGFAASHEGMKLEL